MFIAPDLNGVRRTVMMLRARILAPLCKTNAFAIRSSSRERMGMARRAFSFLIYYTILEAYRKL
jgi:hypothetical protein